MGAGTTGTDARRQELLEAAQKGDEGAYGALIDAHRGELHAHCYRMLGSLHDAEDALQEAMLRAWRGLDRFEGRSSLRSWLYKIATNTCLDAIARRPKRVLPVDYAGAADPHDGPGGPVTESVWVEPYPDETLDLEDGYASPDARYEQREAVELAFIAALQLLPSTQRAVLVLREVLGFSAKEAAETLETTTASVNSALQRARATIDDKLPEQSQQETLRTLGDDEVRELVESYVDAWERDDVEKVVSMLTADAAFTMPPLASWFSGPAEIGGFLAGSPMSGDWDWRMVTTRASGQPAIGYYTWNEEEGAYTPFALNVLTLRGDKIASVDAFIARSPTDPDPEKILRLPDHPPDERKLHDYFEAFGLPARLPGLNARSGARSAPPTLSS